LGREKRGERRRETQIGDRMINTCTRVRELREKEEIKRNVHDNRYVSRNECVYKDKWIRSSGEYMKDKVNYWYEQNKERRTGAEADGEKRNTKVEGQTVCDFPVVLCIATCRDHEIMPVVEMLVMERSTAAVVARVMTMSTMKAKKRRWSAG